jgi:hypothetical protein
MSMTLREYDRVAGTKVYGRLRFNLNEALTFSDEMEDHNPLGARLEQRRGRICPRRLVAPRRAKSALDEYRTDQTHHP